MEICLILGRSGTEGFVHRKDEEETVDGGVLYKAHSSPGLSLYPSSIEDYINNMIYDFEIYLPLPLVASNSIVLRTFCQQGRKNLRISGQHRSWEPLLYPSDAALRT
jgi:hypothetical protein